MKTIAQLDRWLASGELTVEQHSTLAAIVRKNRFSVFLELNALLYLGVIVFVAGLGWTVREHFASLSEGVILLTVFALCLGCLAYCLKAAGPYSVERVESPTFAFDYVLYLGCLAFAVGLAYVEYRFAILKAHWDYYLLASAILYFALAYRFDNRFVLSLALSTLASWFGVRFSMHGLFLAGSLRADALVYSAVVAAAGLWAHRSGIKRHFLETYLHVAVNAALAALVSGVGDGASHWLWLTALLVVCGVTVECGARLGRFAFVAYGVVYGYIGVSMQVLRAVDSSTGSFLYVIVSGSAVLVSLAVLSRRMGREE